MAEYLYMFNINIYRRNNTLTKNIYLGKTLFQQVSLLNVECPIILLSYQYLLEWGPVVPSARCEETETPSATSDI